MGGGLKTESICGHIEKELREVRSDPTDFREYLDIAILAINGAIRAYDKSKYEGQSTAEGIWDYLCEKQRINRFERTWPPISEDDVVIEHIREE